MQQCLKMQYSFTGLSPKEYGIVMQLKLRGLTFQLVYIVRESTASALAICQNLLEQAETVQKYLEENNVTPDEFTFAMLKMLDSLHVRIMVNFPDQQVHLICPRTIDFRSDSSDEVRLLTTISISHQAWTEACLVTISIVLDLRGPETNYNRKLMWKKDLTYIVQLSAEKQVLVSPKPAKRGI